MQSHENLNVSLWVWAWVIPCGLFLCTDKGELCALVIRAAHWTICTHHIPAGVLIDRAVDVQGLAAAVAASCPWGYIFSVSLPTLALDRFCIQIQSSDAFSDKTLNSGMSQRDIESLMISELEPCGDALQKRRVLLGEIMNYSFELPFMLLHFNSRHYLKKKAFRVPHAIKASQGEPPACHYS